MQDFFTTTLSGNVSATDTTMNLNAVPTASEGFLVIDPNNITTREVIYYNSSTSSTVSTPDHTQGSGRGLGGTTVQSHTTGTLVEMREVAEYWVALQNGESLANSAVVTASVAANAITSPLLGLSHALDATNGVQSQANAGNAGGTMYYINLGGIKMCWGQTANQTIGGGAPASAAVAVTLPTSFFSTIQSANATGINVNQSAEFAYVQGGSCSTTTFNLEFVMTVGTAAVYGASYLVIGT